MSAIVLCSISPLHLALQLHLAALAPGGARGCELIEATLEGPSVFTDCTLVADFETRELSIAKAAAESDGVSDAESDVDAQEGNSEEDGSASSSSSSSSFRIRPRDRSNALFFNRSFG